MLQFPQIKTTVLARYDWEISGPPQGWRRAGQKLILPRFPGDRSYIRKFDPQGNVDFKSRIVSCARTAGVPMSATVKPWEGLVRFGFVFYCARPKAMLGSRWADDPIFCWKKPDMDNMEKMVLDALNKIAYRDDAQVCSVRKEKVYTGKTGYPKTEIRMEFFK